MGCDVNRNININKNINENINRNKKTRGISKAIFWYDPSFTFDLFRMTYRKDYLMGLIFSDLKDSYYDMGAILFH